MRSRHHIVPNWSLLSSSSAPTACSNSMQSSKYTKKEKGEQTKKSNKPTQKQGERKSSLELCLDCGIQEYFTLSDPSVNPCWILTPCLDEVWAHHPKSHRRLKVSWESEEKVRLKLLVLMQPFTYVSAGEHLGIWLRKFLQILNLRTPLFLYHFSSVQYFFKSQILLRVREHKSLV